MCERERGIYHHLFLLVYLALESSFGLLHPDPEKFLATVPACAWRANDVTMAPRFHFLPQVDGLVEGFLLLVTICPETYIVMVKFLTVFS